jgi:alpha-galactosidase
MILTALFVFGALAAAQTVYLDELNLGAMECGWGSPSARASVDGNPLKVGGRTFSRGVGTHAVSTMLLNLAGAGKRFTASVGLDDEVGGGKGTIQFTVLGDRKILWESPVMKQGDSAVACDIDLAGIRLLGLLVTDGGDNIDYDHADWCDAKIELASARTPAELVVSNRAEPVILTPKGSDAPRINGARVYGARPGHPFLYKIAASGKAPITYAAVGLPEGLHLDPVTGVIAGTAGPTGEHRVSIAVSNAAGAARRDLLIKFGETIALTPPMGWNSWNSWACSVDDAKVRAAADAMVSSGLIDHGWTYINIDDCWEIKPDAKESELQGTPRSADGMITTNAKFPDMKALGDYVHAKGLKLGIYSGPGPLTCAGFTASYQFEDHDARQYAAWGVDYLKYDWCSYSRIAKDRSLPELKKPYQVMRAALDKVDRDIVYSLCQYGMGNVWEWGAEVGGNCWRTTGDITDSWSSMAEIGFGQAGHEPFAGPGRWNDPDMLVLGMVGWGPALHPTRLTPDEQYTHFTLWSLLASPLLIGADMSHLDEFTMSLLTNDEVIDVNQDPAGNQARRVLSAGGEQVWVKDLEDGSKAVGLFWADDGARAAADHFRWNDDPATRAITISAKDLGMSGKFTVRDLWRQKNLGVHSGKLTAIVPYHGVVLVRVAAAR